jgi:hypothetical protein
LLDSFKRIHPGAPPSLKSVIFRDQWLEAVRENDISKLVLSRTVPVVKTVKTIREKLEKRPEMKYLFDWCLKWIRSERAHLRECALLRAGLRAAGGGACKGWCGGGGPGNQRPCGRCGVRGSAGK